MEISEVNTLTELDTLLEKEENLDENSKPEEAKVQVFDVYDIVDVLPDYILMQDEHGNLVYSVENVDGYTAEIVRAKMCGYGVNLSDTVVKALNGDKQAFDSLPDFTYVVSTVDDSYIGDEEFLEYLMGRDISYIRKSRKDHQTASIGFSPSEQKWYGWSHRAIYGFGVGDEVKEGDLTNTSGYVEEYIIQHPEEDRSLPVGFKAFTLNDAKRMAKAFADAVG